MGVEKESSRNGGGYVGGFFQLFDWKAKSRKKLFSSKSDLPECSKQGKKCEGNLPSTRFHLIDDDEVGAASSFKGSSDYSCASSVTDDEGYGTKAPGVVARLMGLDSLPTSNCAEPYSSPLFDTQSLRDSHYHRKKLSYHHHHQIMHSGSLSYKMEDHSGNLAMESRPQKIPVTGCRPIERFQTEGLPPKSAKSIPITHNKLLSPIKSPGFIPSKNAAYIMEAAAKIIDPGPQGAPKNKMPLISSSSIPLKVRDLKEKVEAGRRTSAARSSAASLRVQEVKENAETAYRTSRFAEASRRPNESNASISLKGQPSSKSWNGSVDTASNRSEENPNGLNNKGKSISLAIQAKVNVQKREGLNSSSNRSLVGQKEQVDGKSGQSSRSQSNTQKNLHKKSSMQNASVLRQNNQKQNCSSDKNKTPSKPSSGRIKGSSKVAANCKTGSRRSSLQAMDTENNISTYGAKNLPRKKRLLEGDYFERNQANHMLSNKNHKSNISDEVSERPVNWTDDGRKKGMDVVSFTFTTPITRPMSKPEATGLFEDENSGFCADHRGKRMLIESDSTKLSSLGYNVIGGDALSLLLEQKLRELSLVVNPSDHDAKVGSTSSSASISHEVQSSSNAEATKTWLTDMKNHALHSDSCAQYDSELSSSGPSAIRSEYNYDSEFSSAGPSALRLEHGYLGADEIDAFSSSKNDVKRSLDGRHPSPISILEPSIWTESCNSSNSTESSIMEGSKQCSSVEAQGIFGLSSAKRFHPLDCDMELSDSASSTSVGTEATKQTIISTATDSVRSSASELQYVKEILCNVELMFRDFALGRAREIVNPHLFQQLESRKERTEGYGNDSRLSRKLLFNGVSECLDLKCRRYVDGGRSTWAKGVAKVSRKDQLAEEVFREISVWRGMGNCMVDELVDNDMSSQYGKWLDFEVDAFSLGVEIEAQIFTSLVDEVVADIMRF